MYCHIMHVMWCNVMMYWLWCHVIFCSVTLCYVRQFCAVRQCVALCINVRLMCIVNQSKRPPKQNVILVRVCGRTWMQMQDIHFPTNLEKYDSGLGFTSQQLTRIPLCPLRTLPTKSFKFVKRILCTLSNLTAAWTFQWFSHFWNQVAGNVFLASESGRCTWPDANWYNTSGFSATSQPSKQVMLDRTGCQSTTRPSI